MKSLQDKEKIKLQIINLKMTRIISFRYMVPVLFFINLYLTLYFLQEKSIFAFVSITNAIGAICCLVEQFIMVRKKNDTYNFHLIYFILNILLNFILVIFAKRYYVLIIIFIDIFLIYKVILIQKNKDRFTKKYKSMLQKLYKEI